MIFSLHKVHRKWEEVNYAMAGSIPEISMYLIEVIFDEYQCNFRYSGSLSLETKSAFNK